MQPFTELIRDFYRARQSHAGFSEPGVILLASLFMVATGATVLQQKLVAIYPLSGHLGFVFSVFVVQWLLLAILVAMLAIVVPVRPVLAFLLLVTAVSGYFSRAYGSVIDSSMVQNLVETDVQEAMGLATPGLVLQVLLLGIVPSALLWLLPVKRERLPRRLLSSSVSVFAGLLLVTGCVLANNSNFASFLREHKEVRFHSNPIYPVYSMVRYGVDSVSMMSAPGEFQISMPDASLPAHMSRELVIVVVGETVRWDHLSLNGYQRDTSPRLSKVPGLTSYNNVTSCGTTTAVSVPCMFSFTGADEFSREQIETEENVLDVLQRVGVSVLWRDNNSGSKGVADRVDYEDFSDPGKNPACDPECRDIGMLEGLQAYIDQQPGDVLVVLHQMGNHGPEYYLRYPAEEEFFVPACQSAELASCSREEIINAYDNAVRYTDYFLSGVIHFLEGNADKYQVTMLYLGDHGESLGESGLYLHGMPVVIAPREQTRVPLLLWTADNSDILPESVIERQDRPFSHDALASSLLLAFEVKDLSIDDTQTYFSIRYPEIATTAWY